MPRWGHLHPRAWLRVPVPSELLLEVTSLFFSLLHFPLCQAPLRGQSPGLWNFLCKSAGEALGS